MGKSLAFHAHPKLSDNERGNEPSQAYRHDLPQRADAIYVNLRTRCGYRQRFGQLAARYRIGGGVLVVVRDRESLSHGEGGQLNSMPSSVN